MKFVRFNFTDGGEMVTKTFRLLSSNVERCRTILKRYPENTVFMNNDECIINIHHARYLTSTDFKELPTSVQNLFQEMPSVPIKGTTYRLLRLE
jgi:hypothetical protein